MANTAFDHSASITVPSSTVNNRVITWNGTTGKNFNNTALVSIAAGVVTGVTALTVDNLTIDGNTITSTDTNGNITLTPNGSGSVVADTVGNSEMSFNGTVLDLKNNGTQSSIKLYCETGNAHYQEIRGGPHSGATSYTMILPHEPPTANQVLTTASISSNVAVLNWADASSDITVQEEGSSLSTAATTLNFVGSAVTASGTGTTKTITITGGYTPVLTRITSAGTTNWSKPATANMVYIECIGAGGGGAGGGQGSANRPGGGAGAGGARATRLMRAADISGSTVSVTVGAGGNGGAGSSSGSTSTDGSPGTNTTFGGYLTGYGGSYGSGGANHNGGSGGGISSAGTTNGTQGSRGGEPNGGRCTITSDAYALISMDLVTPQNSVYGGGASGGSLHRQSQPGDSVWGGGGGGFPGHGTAIAADGGKSVDGGGGGGGGAGHSSNITPGAGGGSGPAGGGGGSAGSGSGADGQNGTAGSASGTYGGGGGGGGAGHASGDGGDGGDGATGGGGGGGGAGTGTGGAGGDGGDGEIRIWTW